MRKAWRPVLFAEFFLFVLMVVFSGSESLPAKDSPGKNAAGGQASSQAQMMGFFNCLTGGKAADRHFKETIPFEFTGKFIMVPVRINNGRNSYLFTLDTYSPCIIWNSLLNDMNMKLNPLSGQLADAFEETLLKPAYTRYDSIKIGNLKFENICSMVMDDSEHAMLFDYLDNGIIGATLLRSCIWQINFQDTTITATDGIASLGYIEGAIEVPFIPEGPQKSPIVEVVVDDADTMRLQFDTGNSSTYLACPLLKKDSSISRSELKVCYKTGGVSILKTDGMQTDTTYCAMAGAVKIGTRTFKDVPVDVVESEQGKSVGSMGIEFIRNFITTIDWPSNKIYLFPIRGKGIEHNRRVFGVKTGYVKGAVRVTAVYAGSEAEKRGIEIGDRILSINNNDVENLSADQARKFRLGALKYYDENDEYIRLELIVNGKREKVRLKSYNLF